MERSVGIPQLRAPSMRDVRLVRIQEPAIGVRSEDWFEQQEKDLLSVEQEVPVASLPYEIVEIGWGLEAVPLIYSAVEVPVIDVGSEVVRVKALVLLAGLPAGALGGLMSGDVLRYLLQQVEAD
jgi:hypothetical protein